jgi:hypothetical protein
MPIKTCKNNQIYNNFKMSLLQKILLVVLVLFALFETAVSKKKEVKKAPAPAAAKKPEAKPAAKKPVGKPAPGKKGK